MRNSSVAAAAPVVAALLALGLVAATGLSQRSDLPDWLAPRAYGFFLDSYPLFAFALAYGLARLVAAAAAPGPAGVPRRAVWGVVGIAALLLASLYPTFGGVILRGAYGTGSMAFLTGQPLWLAYALGAAVGALLFGTILGLFGWLAAGRLRPRTGWRARIGGACRDGISRRLSAPAARGRLRSLAAGGAIPHSPIQGERTRKTDKRG
ncbi:hypothetical protein, partial [Methylobacterium sp. WL12]|uniref:hypothetical protein n=1 Tax=Methylobacterium sp. WL12 TaxID=2603890 RepID=UPI00164F010E